MYQEDLSYGLFLSDRQLDFLSNYPQGFDRMKCFATFLQMAVKETTHYEKKEYSVDLTSGQFAISEVELAKLWKCNRKTASKMVDMFHEVGLVSSVPNCRTTVFTLYRIAVPQSSQSIVLPVGISAIRLFAMHITHAILRSSSASRLTIKVRMLPKEVLPMELLSAVLLLMVVLPKESLPIKLLQKIA